MPLLVRCFVLVHWLMASVRLWPSTMMMVTKRPLILTVLCIEMYRKDTEPFISCFRVLTYNPSFQYLSIHAMSAIACYNYIWMILIIVKLNLVIFVIFGSRQSSYFAAAAIKMKCCQTPAIIRSCFSATPEVCTFLGKFWLQRNCNLASITTYIRSS